MKARLTPKDNKVLQVIEDNPGCQNNDARLLDVYWHQADDWDDSKSLYWNLSRVTPAESITRSRRKLHELGYITYSKDADAAREKKFVEYRIENGEQIAIFR